MRLFRKHSPNSYRHSRAKPVFKHIRRARDDMRKPLKGKPPRGIQGRGLGGNNGCVSSTCGAAVPHVWEEAPMTYITSIGLDVHARSVSACAFDPFTGEVAQMFSFNKK